MDILTKGNVIVNNIKVGDIHYEFECGCCIKSEVLTLPIEDGNGYWSWKSRSLKTGEEITYGIREDMRHYGPNLYDCEAYVGCKFI
jgi:hypothetical protein